ncbi:hypothetical protein Afil01_51430 [Actinorhabdospora filicis]|uniref:2'-5' RNA ligase family protein n=1 Tax=Actinorhabdospora filicis TaxID=1785913 RepID=A0A9W6ST91_9ACTN|nr:2'-5' RNA ligase family protein [Actinorhabdospora filicis]GLZ80336.1 hypothetical protein Afil01_51430 [Actinorhabdospora filicis]
MSEDQPGYRAGDTALLISLPEAHEVIGPWVAETGSAGVDAHVTVLVPFLDAGEIDDGVLAELRGLFAAHPAFELSFAGFGRFPGVLYLVPEPAGPVHALTTAVVSRWPQCPPYGGIFDEVVPHLTVVHGRDDATRAAAEAALEARLPVRARAEAVDLLVFDGERWRPRARFPLATG